MARPPQAVAYSRSLSKTQGEAACHPSQGRAWRLRAVDATGSRTKVYWIALHCTEWIASRPRVQCNAMYQLGGEGRCQQVTAADRVAKTGLHAGPNAEPRASKPT